MDKRIEKTLHHLQEALLLLIREKPLVDITVSELCRCADVNRGTFYKHFSNVHDVFDLYFGRIIADLEQSYHAPLNVANYNVTHIEKDTIRIFHHVKQFEAFYRIALDPNMPMTYYHQLFSFIKQLMEETIGSISDERQRRFQASTSANMIMGMIMQWHEEDYQLTPAELNHYFFQILRANEERFYE